MEPVDEAELYSRAKAGERAALEELLEQQYSWVARLCLMECGNEALAKDCLQEAMIELARSLPKFNGRSRLKTWAFVLVKRVIFRFKKKEQLQQTRFPLGDKQDVSLEINLPGAEKLFQSENERLIFSALKALPERQRHAIYFHYFEDLSVEDTARQLNCAASTVKVHLLRGREKLREIILAYERQEKRN